MRLHPSSLTADFGSPVSGGGACTPAREIGNTICDRIFGGETLSQICRDAAMPDKPTVMRWLAQHPTFLDEYVFTCRLLAEDLAAARRRLPSPGSSSQPLGRGPADPENCATI
jgi:hypothetical protein